VTTRSWIGAGLVLANRNDAAGDARNRKWALLQRPDRRRSLGLAAPAASAAHGRPVRKHVGPGFRLVLRVS